MKKVTKVTLFHYFFLLPSGCYFFISDNVYSDIDKRISRYYRKINGKIFKIS